MLWFSISYICYSFCDIFLDVLTNRMVNGLLKTAQGPPAGVPTTLVPPQDTTMKSEAMKCLVAILRSMGDWMNKQLRIPDPASPNVESEKNDNDGGNELPQADNNGDESSEASDSHSELSNGISEAASLEQRRAYKIELQVDDTILLVILLSVLGGNVLVTIQLPASPILHCIC